METDIVSGASVGTLWKRQTSDCIWQLKVDLFYTHIKYDSNIALKLCTLHAEVI